MKENKVENIKFYTWFIMQGINVNKRDMRYYICMYEIFMHNAYTWIILYKNMLGEGFDPWFSCGCMHVLTKCDRSEYCKRRDGNYN